MNVALRRPAMTREEFLDWAERQEERYEFDGREPVAMTGGSANHSNITLNIHGALRARLRGSACWTFGPDAGVAVANGSIRYPDALVTCEAFPGQAKLIPGMVIVFEVVSPSSLHTDYIVKVREYQAVPSILRYVIAAQDSAGLAVLHRARAGDEWTATTLIAGETLAMPEIGIEVPVDEFYERVKLLPTPGGASQPTA